MQNFLRRYMRSSKFIKIDGTEYVFDIDKIVDFFNYSDKTSSKETEILDNYEFTGEGMNKTSKSIRELTTAGNMQTDNIKYDLIKTFIFRLTDYDDAGRYVDNIEDLPFGAKLCFNTLINEGFLKIR